jgi:hypothetical protein
MVSNKCTISLLQRAQKAGPLSRAFRIKYGNFLSSLRLPLPGARHMVKSLLSSLAPRLLTGLVIPVGYWIEDIVAYILSEF